MHTEPHPLAGQTVKIADDVDELAGQDYTVEDYWDRVVGKSWMDSTGIPACWHYVTRTGKQDKQVPRDDEVLYGHVDGYGKLVHVSELVIAEAAK